MPDATSKARATLAARDVGVCLDRPRPARHLGARRQTLNSRANGHDSREFAWWKRIDQAGSPWTSRPHARPDAGRCTLALVSPEHTSPTATLARHDLTRRLRELTLRVHEPASTRTLTRARVSGGRSRTADLMIDHPSVSGLHFELRIGEAGIELIDLDSRNGCWLGDRRVRHVELRPGDVFRAGECRIELLGAREVEVELARTSRYGELLGHSPVMRELFALLERLAPTPIDILVLGETGTGKELVARAIHGHSKRASGPLRVLDCGSLAPSLAEAALFGHRKGAFTGADRDQAGVFEEAEGGTLLLDEVGELPLELQVKLLRVLDRREVARVGEPAKLRTVDVRVIAATHRDLRKMVAEGRFREDLYFRLARAIVELPPLRERGDDIGLLAREFVRASAARHQLGVTLDDEALAALARHAWPGNVRELQNVVERAAFVVADRPIHAGDLQLDSLGPHALRLVELARSDDYWRAHEALDRVLLARMLAQVEGNLSEAARRLAISRPKLRKRLRELGLYAGEGTE
jgi:DNA-binding NtrC family response regulator